MTIEEFIKARASEELPLSPPSNDVISDYGDEDFRNNFYSAIIKILEWHDQWPVFVETPPELKTNFLDDFDTSVNRFQMSMIGQFTFLTQQEYRKKFGDEPPTAPVVRVLAAIWKHHPDYNDEWSM